MTVVSTVCLRACLRAIIFALEAFILIKDWALERDECPNSNLRMVIVADMYLQLCTLDSCIIQKYRPAWAKFAIFPVFFGWVGYEVNLNVCTAMASSMMYNFLFYQFWILVGLASLTALFALGIAVVQVSHWHYLATTWSSSSMARTLALHTSAGNGNDEHGDELEDRDLTGRTQSAGPMSDAQRFQTELQIAPLVQV
jgi:hypothetical protein